MSSQWKRSWVSSTRGSSGDGGIQTAGKENGWDKTIGKVDIWHVGIKKYQYKHPNKENVVDFEKRKMNFKKPIAYVCVRDKLIKMKLEE